MYQNQLQKELNALKKADRKENPLEQLEPKILNGNGKVNWWWVVLNIGRVIARILFAIKEGKK